MKRNKLLLLLLTSSLVLSACSLGDSIPISKEENEDEYKQVTAYASEMLMKYSYNLVDDLTYVEIKNSEKAVAASPSTSQGNAFAGISISKGEDEPVDEPVIEPEAEPLLPDTPVIDDNSNAGEDSGDETSAPETEPSEDDNGYDNPVIAETPADNSTDASGEGENETPIEGNDNEDIDTHEVTNEPQDTLMDIQQALQNELGGLKLVYNGNSKLSAYPSMFAQGAVVAGDNEKILVLNFTLANQTGQDIDLDILSHGMRFRVFVNGKQMKYAEVTMLSDDLRGFKGVVAAGSEQNVVLLEKLPQQDVSNINSISLEIAGKGFSHTVALE
ncbi:hypothetical protein [Butyrivibrio sp. MC2013]|uniref:hypothetical protein n=1 Tax=Butyrivibrio sp. MC2013 TaxID=1280686 RepID=UPI000412B982|nr:hypothetical protein [Butyrivibrio sp. MC2013]